jgi:hypothetical protein
VQFTFRNRRILIVLHFINNNYEYGQLNQENLSMRSHRNILSVRGCLYLIIIIQVVKIKSALQEPALIIKFMCEILFILADRGEDQTLIYRYRFWSIWPSLTLSWKKYDKNE